MGTERLMNEVVEVLELCEAMITQCIENEECINTDVYLEDDDQNMISWFGIPEDVYVTLDNVFVLESRELRLSFSLDDIDEAFFDVATGQYVFTRRGKKYILSHLA